MFSRSPDAAFCGAVFNGAVLPRIALSFLNVKQYALWRIVVRQITLLETQRKEECGMKLNKISYYSSSCGRPAIGFRS